MLYLAETSKYVIVSVIRLGDFLKFVVTNSLVRRFGQLFISPSGHTGHNVTLSSGRISERDKERSEYGKLAV